MLEFLLSPIGKIVGYAVGILTLLGLVFGFYEIKIAEAKAEALATFNQQQLTQALADEQTYMKQMQTLEADKEAIQARNILLNGEIKDQADSASHIITNSKDTQTDPLFNEVLKELKGAKK